MREPRRMATEPKDNFKLFMYLASGVLGIAIITFVITFNVYSNKVKKEELARAEEASRFANALNNTIRTSQASSDISKSVNQVQNTMANETNTIILETSIVSEEVEIVDNTEEEYYEPEIEQVSGYEAEVIPDPTFIKPVEGQIIREYAMEKLIYSETLKESIRHPGIDIKADRTTVVKAAADGKVQSIKNDPRYGLTVIVEHVNGFTTVYSNLLTAEFVKVGEVVTQGQTLGTVGNTASFEILDPPHLHFEILKDNNQVDPTTYIAF